MESNLLYHPMFAHAGEISTICQPLHKLQITYFCHVRIDKNQKFSAICNNPEFAEHYLNNEYYNVDIHFARSIVPGNYVMWDALERSGKSAIMHQEAKQFGIQHTFTIIQEDNSGKNYYHFANNAASQSINQVYLANLDLLALFIDYFKEHMLQSKALYNAYQFKYCIDSTAPGYTIKTPHQLLLNMHDRLAFSQTITTSKNSLIDNCQSNALPDKMKLSPQKMKCLMLLLQGNSSKQIAKVMQLSSRTIEHYISDIRNKFNCKNSKDLIAFYYSSFYKLNRPLT